MMEPTLQIARRIVANAQRLYDDAEILFQQGRFPSATALYVMCTEELGKLAMLVRGDATTSDPSKHKGFHKAKHGAVSITHLSQASMMAAHAVAGRVGQKFVRTEDAPPDVQVVGITDFLLALPPAEFEAYMEAFKEQLAAVPKQALANCSSPNQAEEMRKRALYLDFNEDGVKSDPSEIGQADAFSWREYAEITLSLIDVSDLRIRTIRLPSDT